MRSCKVCNAETHPTFLSLVPKAAFWELSPATLPEGLPPACTGPGAAMVGSGSSSPNMASYTMDCSRNPKAVCLQGFLRLRAALIEGPSVSGFSGDPSLQLLQRAFWETPKSSWDSVHHFAWVGVPCLNDFVYVFFIVLHQKNSEISIYIPIILYY